MAPPSPRVLGLALAPLVLSGCIASSPHADLTVIDPSKVTITGHSGVTAADLVGRDGEVSGVQTLDAMGIDGDEVNLPVCWKYHRGGCSHVKLTTPMSNVRLLRERDVPERFVGAAELLYAAGLITAGALLWRGEGQSTESGPALLVTSGGVLAVVGAIQTFRPARTTRTVVGPEEVEPARE
jgi:hypothetical protein